MSDTTTIQAAQGSPGVIIAAYVFGAIGLMIILGVAFCILRRIRGHRARKYIKQQSNRTTGMGPVLTSPPPKVPWDVKTVKDGVKARQAESNQLVAEAKALEREEAEHQNGSTVSMNGNGATTSSQPISTISLGPTRKKMHGQNYDRAMRVKHARTIKHERMRIRLEHKRNKKEGRTRQKEIKSILTQMMEDTLDGTFVPSSANGRPNGDDRSSLAALTPETTRVGPLRRESLAAIPDISYLIEKSPRDRKAVSGSLQRTQGGRSLEVPQSLHTWDEESSGSSRAQRSPRHSRNPSAEFVDVTVHRITDPQTYAYHNEALQDVEDTTEL